MEVSSVASLVLVSPETIVLVYAATISHGLVHKSGDQTTVLLKFIKFYGFVALQIPAFNSMTGRGWN